MRVVSLHPDVLVATSAVWQTTCTIVRGQIAGTEESEAFVIDSRGEGPRPAEAFVIDSRGEGPRPAEAFVIDSRGEGPRPAEAFVIDSPVLPQELEALPTLLTQAGFPFSGLLATHGDWDHLLGRLAFGPEAPLGVAETTAARLTGEPGDAARRLREFDQEWYVTRPAPLALGSLQALPVPGHLDVGDQTMQLHPTGGHTADGMAVWIPWARVLVVGDHLSPVELPMLSDGGSRNEYLATLGRLAPLVQQADMVVPGHGAVLDGTRAMAILREDVAYLQDWTLPIARRDPAQLKVHARNQERAG